MDLQFYLEPPELTHHGSLLIDPLTPLSMVANQPGTYYRTASKPTEHMVLGLLENALGLHLDDDQRRDLFKELTKKVKKAAGRKSEWKDHPWFTGKPIGSDAGFKSLLQHHVEILHISEPEFDAFDDLGSFHFRTDASTLIGGSRSYDYRMEYLIEQSRKKPAKADFSDTAKHKSFSPEELLEQTEGKINTKSAHYFFPRYYVSPKVRGYIIPKDRFEITIQTTPMLWKELTQAIHNPKAPLYLGTNDSWVDLTWKDHD